MGTRGMIGGRVGDRGSGFARLAAVPAVSTASSPAPAFCLLSQPAAGFLTLGLPVLARDCGSYKQERKQSLGFFFFFFFTPSISETALSLRERGICAVWPGLLQDPRWPQGGRLCPPFFGEQISAPRAHSERCLGCSLNTGGRKGFPVRRCCNDTRPRSV